MVDKNVLVGVLKSQRDMKILRERLWYRIPLRYAPKRKPEFVAFYEPATDGRYGVIRYYGMVKNLETAKRIELIPEEPLHPMAGEDYLKINFDTIEALPEPIANRSKMRISFAFTSLYRLLTSTTTAELLGINPIEDITAEKMKEEKMFFLREHVVRLKKGRRYRLDFAFFCRNGRLDVECDSEKWHSLKKQRFLDRMRDKTLKKIGWTIFRLREKEIMEDMGRCLDKIKENMKKLGGLN